MSNSGKKLLFGKFEIIQTIKKDEFANVYSAQHHYLGKRIIVKTLDTNNLSDQTVKERFKREAKILAHLDHTNIIRVLDFGSEQNQLYISFEFFESRNLREYLKQEKPNDEEKKRIFIQLLKGLDYAHRSGVVHRDIKPENILVNEKSILKIADFGLASATNDSGVTMKSTILGTPSYMSPEQITGGEISFQSDLFSVGIVAFEMYTGINPFAKNDINSTINYILNYDELALDGINSIPEDVRDIIAKLLKKNKAKRSKTCIEALAEMNVPVEEIRNKEVKNESVKHKWWLIPIFLMLFVLVYYIGFKGSNSDLERRNQTISKEENPVRETVSMPTRQKGTSHETNNKTEDPSGLPLKKEEIIKNEKDKTEEVTDIDVSINCTPWATVYITDRRVDITPVNKTLQLKEGLQEIKMVHPDYPEYITRVEVKKGVLLSLKVNLDEVFGSVGFQVLPWGEVFINGKSYGETPIMRKIHLETGSYEIIIKNPDFPVYSEKVKLSKGEDLLVKHNFAK